LFSLFLICLEKGVSFRMLCALTIFIVLKAVTVVIASLFLYLATLQGARKLHDNILTNVLRLPMSYFDTTPQGRILNRFEKHFWH